MPRGCARSLSLFEYVRQPAEANMRYMSRGTYEQQQQVKLQKFNAACLEIIQEREQSKPFPTVHGMSGECRTCVRRKGIFRSSNTRFYRCLTIS
jgi:hypothetical protein